ncbi:type-F conjugative transfer system protein TrbI (plasmid) [Pectobacteriaceae bacterium CE70]|nr:type-F conjugative transfer system protein TrbI [Prodigiosinella sp. LS101]WJV60594.1 type-F conjugative transfer system protein TrbI [Pectobacteriaceae bacterium C111]WJV64871.1 type-F conjugative transfer system protein TrbI [Pectobacteriaceae bacterium C52]WJV69198.1 type-F conjugative transfer system protein TrbI [Pectobacteriaceae bacterium CE70]WJY13125.1 type-F conjugative transfer system protein TrbI [Pectobacteriaceae bacterium C80]WJY17418.1 type-F conjugative transfer system prot
MNETDIDAQNVRQGISITPASKAGFFNKKFVRAGAVALLLTLLLVTVCAGISALVAQQFQCRTVVFDMKGTIDLFMQQSAKKQLDENSARVLTTRFDQALKASLNDWQQAHGDLILVPPAVVTPVLDITPQIQADIAHRMQEAP